MQLLWAMEAAFVHIRLHSCEASWTQADKLSPDVICFNAAISACVRSQAFSQLWSACARTANFSACDRRSSRSTVENCCRRKPSRYRPKAFHKLSWAPIRARNRDNNCDSLQLTVQSRGSACVSDVGAGPRKTFQACRKQ